MTGKRSKRSFIDSSHSLAEEILFLKSDEILAAFVSVEKQTMSETTARMCSKFEMSKFG